MSATTILFRKTSAPGGLQAFPGPVPPGTLEALKERAGLAGLTDRVGRVLARRPSMSIAGATLAVCAVSWISAFLLQFGGAVPSSASSFMLRALPLVVLLKGIVLWMTGVFRIVWA